MKADMISGAMEAETALAKEEAQEMERDIDSLPDGHPLKTMAAQQKQMSGDLAGLPPGHPLVMAIEEARQRYEEQSFQEEETDNKEQAEIRRAKKLDAKKAAREQRRREDERNERLTAATKRINASMSETMDSLKRLSENIQASQEDFKSDQYALMKLDRLNRVVTASIRGVAESKLNAGRVLNG